VQVIWKQQSVRVEPFDDGHGVGCLFDDYPRVVTDLAFGDLISVVVYGTFELPSGDRPEPGRTVVGDTSTLQVEHYWWSGRIPYVRYSSPGRPTILDRTLD
jgi:hypothetical protein